MVFSSATDNSRQTHRVAAGLLILLGPVALALLILALNFLPRSTPSPAQIAAPPTPYPISPTNQPPVDPARVLVVFNTKLQESRAVVNDYVDQRRIPFQNILALSCSTTMECPQDEYRNVIERAIQQRLRENPDLDYVVLFYGVPVRIHENSNSVDNTLAVCLMEKRPPAVRYNRLLNPYFGRSERFSRARFGGMVLVTRLDGPSIESVRQLMRSARNAQPVTGPFYLRHSFVLSMSRAAQVLKNRGFTVAYIAKEEIADTPDYANGGGPWMAHWGAGPHDKQFSQAEYDQMKFLPGALADITWSVSASAIRKEKTGTQITTMTRNGAAGAQGYVAEPYSDTVSKPEIVLDRYTRGYNLAESFYMGSPYLNWRAVILGDPLCAPYAYTGGLLRRDSAPVVQ